MKDRETVGVELYGVQQELARHQMMLEKNHDEHSKCNQDRSQTEQRLNEIRRIYREKQTSVSSEKKKGMDYFGIKGNIFVTI